MNDHACMSRLVITTDAPCQSTGLRSHPGARRAADRAAASRRWSFRPCPTTATTSSSSEREAPVRQPRCSWRAQAIGSCSSTVRRFRAIPSRRISFIRPESRHGAAGASSIASSPRAVRPIDTYAFDFGPFTLTGSPGEGDEPLSYAPRRTVLDEILVDAADVAGAEVRRRLHGRWPGVRCRSRYRDPGPRPRRLGGGRTGDDRGRSGRAAFHGG